LLFNQHGEASQRHAEDGEDADPEEMTLFQAAPLLT